MWHSSTPGSASARPAARSPSTTPGIDGRAASGLVDFLAGHPRGRRRHAGRLRHQGRDRRPAGRHDRRLLRRGGPAGHRRRRPPPRRAGPAHHLERPLLLPRPQQRGTYPGRHRAAARRLQVAVDERLLPDRRGASGCCIRTSTRRGPAAPAVCTSSRRPATPSGAGLRQATRPTGPTRCSAYARSVSPVSYLASVKAPTLLVQGQADSLFNLNEAAATYRTLGRTGHPGQDDLAGLGPQRRDEEARRRANSTWRRATWTPATSAGGSSRGSTAICTTGRTTDTGPAFAYYRDWVTDGPAYATAARLPGGRQPARCTSPATASSSTTAARWRAAAGSTAICGPHQPLRELAGRAARPAGRRRRTTPRAPTSDWTSEPLAGGPVDVVGAPRATLKVVLTEGRAGAELLGRGRQARPVRQALRRRAGRQQDAGAPVGRPGPGARRDPELHRDTAGHRAPVRAGAPAAVRHRRERRRVLRATEGSSR